MYAAQTRSGVPSQYPFDRASQVSQIGGTVKPVSSKNTTGRVAVITGASSGIGEATARALAADGHGVALLARRLDRIHALADDLGDGAIAIQADVTDRDSILAAAERVQDDLGGADILVNNAGVMLLGPFSTELSDDYRRMIETNLLGAITTTEVFLDQVVADGGDLINLSSVAGRTARPGPSRPSSRCIRRPQSHPRRSPRSSPSPFPDRAACRSTRSSSAPPGRRCDDRTPATTPTREERTPP
jgi:NAD(P)-dependent dehydrogenase (short-subunit alcohol dehydrogenase family)